MSVTLPSGATRTRLERRISADGVDLRIDDDLASLTNVMQEAWTEVLGYCLNRYSETQLAASEWTLLRWTDLAVMNLCERRNNPAPQSVCRKHEKAIADLERVEAGTKNIADCATRKAAAPTLSNQRVRLSPIPNLAVTPHNSTGDAQGYDQKTDPLDFDPNPRG